MKVFDAHAHLGADVVFDVEVDEARLLEVYAANGVDGALVQPFLPRPYLEETRNIHDRHRPLLPSAPWQVLGHDFHLPAPVSPAGGGRMPALRLRAGL